MSSPTPSRGSPFTDLGVAVPLVAAPMAGGPTTPALVTAAARAGGLGFLAGGYKTAEQLHEQILEVRRSTAVFGVNLFAPNPAAIDAARYRQYSEALRPLAESYGVTLPPDPVEDDDGWEAKLELLRHDPVPVVSFTFGIPDRAVIDALRAQGSIVVQTVTSVPEAHRATEAGVDLLAVQGWAAGGHSATLTPEHFPEPIPTAVLVAMIRDATRVPVIAAGGIGTASQVASLVRSGAEAVMVGTALLRTPESGTNPVHRAALSDAARGATVLTRSFTGRPARALRNRFVDRYDALAPVGYPAIHHLTNPIRRAAVAAGDPEAVHLWAGTGYEQARPLPATDVLAALASAL